MAGVYLNLNPALVIGIATHGEQGLSSMLSGRVKRFPGERHCCVDCFAGRVNDRRYDLGHVYHYF